jgi:hypothetical protein
MVGGATDNDSVVTLWIDRDGAIRRIVEVREIDPDKVAPQPGGKSLGVEGFVTVTTIELKPVFDEKVPDSDFVFEVQKNP